MARLFCFILFFSSIVLWGHSEVENYRPGYAVDDYYSSVDFSLAEPVSRNDIKYVHFNNDGLEVNLSNLPNVPTKILIHGWLTSIEKSPWYPKFKDAYISAEESVNVIYVDYETISTKKYSVVAGSTIVIANAIGDHLLDSKISLDNLHLIGHSLGSHVAAYLGRYMFERFGKKVGRITLLDPAGPKFNKTKNIINSNDAMFVDVVHTDNGHYGLTESVGHVDFFPNGGSYQTGCPSFEEDDNCSHARSTLFFLESIKNKKSIAKKAFSWDDFKAGKFLEEEGITFGEHVPTSAKGNYYFVTNPSTPYF